MVGKKTRMRQLSASLDRKLQDIPNKPGVYIMRDICGKVIYVGKASSLRSRVRHYFQQGTFKIADAKLRSLINSIYDLDYIILKSEAEAIITEGKLIKDYRPMFNILFKDDKQFPLLRINLKDKWPYFTLCRIKKNDSALYFGPYASSTAARAALDFVCRYFKLRQCHVLELSERDHKHCHNDIIRNCSAPCIGKISEGDYCRHVMEACAFLRGERPRYLNELKAQMAVEAKKLNFEKAAALRDSIRQLLTAIKERNISYKKQYQWRSSAKIQAGLEELKKILDLKFKPLIIEAFDISNISGTFSVGSMVRIKNGVADKRGYRMFKIKTVTGINDPAMIAEIINRRYKRLIAEKSKMPDLILVDGGITQLRAAKGQLIFLGLSNINIIGLAKRFEEVYLENGEIINIPKESEALKILQRLRDEAHRFALTYHRYLRNKKINESILDDIVGVSKNRKEALLKHFGSIKYIKDASVEEIAQISKIGMKIAKIIKDKLS